MLIPPADEAERFILAVRAIKSALFRFPLEVVMKESLAPVLLPVVTARQRLCPGQRISLSSLFFLADFRSGIYLADVLYQRVNLPLLAFDNLLLFFERVDEDDA
jgi:hypothetical protein